MKKIYICYDNKLIKSKFIENIKHIKNLSFVETNNNIDILKYFYLGVKNYIFHYSKLDSYVLYFLENQKNNKDINFYIDMGPNKIEDIDTSKLSNVKYLIRSKNTKDDKTIDISQYVSAQFLEKQTTEKKLDIACGFLTEVLEIPKELIGSLEIKSKDYKIRLFDNHKINHPFNVGTLSEKEKYKILQSYRYFINIDNAYLNEALVSGCVILNKTLELATEVSSKQINNILPIDSFIENFCS